MVVFSIVILFFSMVLVFSSSWAFAYFGLSCFEQIVFHTKVPLEGTNTEFIFDWVKKCLLKAIILTVCIYGVIVVSGLDNWYFVLAVAIFLLGLAAARVGLFTFIKNLFQKTDLYEEAYVDGKTVAITFPKKKRNLIYIYVESLENTYSSKENGGAYSSDLLAPLSSYAFQNTHFSSTEKLGGASVVAGTGWTTGGIVAQSGGVPLLTPISQKKFAKDSDFLPGLYSLGDILQKEGYIQEYLIGSDAMFGGRAFYFKKHGDFKIFDLKEAYKEAKIPKDYKEFWGYEDEKLFAFAKDELLHLADQEQPFNFTMLTVDTHHPYGYVCQRCEHQYPERLSNVIACNCKQLGQFLEWIQEQSFYENTTVIISGDHLSMAAEYIHKTYDKQYERTIFNTILNAIGEASNSKNRQFTSFDMFPTTLASMGVQIEGNRLGLGVNLFSDEKTLLERYGYTYIDKELRKQSDYYRKKILKSSFK